jgi:hypothetical protein
MNRMELESQSEDCVDISDSTTVRLRSSVAVGESAHDAVARHPLNCSSSLTRPQQPAQKRTASHSIESFHPHRNSPKYSILASKGSSRM